MASVFQDLINFYSYKKKGVSPYAALLSEKEHVLDIGCGEGEFEKQFTNFYGLDISQENIKKALPEGKGRLIQGDAAHLPIKNESFDGVILNNVLEHLYPEQALLSLREVDRILKKGGDFLLATQLERKGNFDTFTHKRPYPPNSIKKLLDPDNFEPTINGWKIRKLYFKGRYHRNRVLRGFFKVVGQFGIFAQDYVMLIHKEN
ncbi:MAG: methyltransferase domain-containing protein [Candidatus Aminicenantes bacterium]|nr:methyltransferase domain-containing protein [Candidatus Aminicenantes bacterium]